MKKIFLNIRVSLFLFLLIGILGVSPSVQAWTLGWSHSFTGGSSDGSMPWAGVIMDSDGNLYGTTTSGGANGGYGTVYTLSSNGTGFILLHSFTYTDGTQPHAGVIMDSDGNLYGTTSFGGSLGLNFGTVYKLSSNDAIFSVLHDFAGGRNDGANSYADLMLDASGNLYGSTGAGGSKDKGTLFMLSSSGEAYNLLRSFTGRKGDGDYPQSGLIMDSQGNFYGATGGGGTNGIGVIYKLNIVKGKWKCTVLHSFNGADGYNPQGPLVMDSNGNIYGTTVAGGINDKGTVFMVSSDASIFEVLHNFSGPDGANPCGGVIIGNDANLYGTTRTGGDNGVGTVFGLNKATGYSYTRVYHFTGEYGSYPNAGVIMDSNGNLYGTALLGGDSNAGTVFQLIPSVD